MRELISDDFSGYIITSLLPGFRGRLAGLAYQVADALWLVTKAMLPHTLTSLVFGMLNSHGFIVSRPRPTTCSETDV